MNELNRQFRHLNLDRDVPRRGFGQRLRGVSQIVARNAFGERRHSPDHRQREISVPGYQTVKSLKTGGMSDAILLVKDRRHGKLFIAKRVSASGSPYERAAAELRTLNCIRRGQNLNLMKEHFWDPSRNHLTLILEYCDAGNLDDMIQLYRKRGQRVGEGFLWHVLLGIANALAYLHWGIADAASGSHPVRNWNTICHLDIKPPNVFLSNSGRTNSHPRIVLGDFGCSVSQSDIVVGEAHPRIQAAGTPGFFPPESESRSGEQRYGPSSDMWMLGATVQALARRLGTPDKLTLPGSRPLGSSYGRTINCLVSHASARNFRERPNAQQLVREIRKRGIRG
jgi:serine/threonine protein kinase